MNKPQKKQAFTLTELLVVIVIAGILAAVALPKFNAVVETRRTGEAEELSAAIRNEQEKRCALDQSYTMNASRIGVAGTNTAGASFSKGSFEYELTEKGLIASRSDKDYKLVMPSYKDGRIYCEGEYCEKLNKNYPTEAELTNSADYHPADDCAAVAAVTPCEQDPNSCECNPNQAKCCPEGTEWNGSSCVTSTSSSCDASQKPSDDGTKVACQGNTCGFQTRSYYCDASTNYEWRLKLAGDCLPEPPNKEPCPSGIGFIFTDEWGCIDGEWVGLTGGDSCDCDPATKPEEEQQKCNKCGVKTRKVRCDRKTYTWTMDADFGECSVSSEDDCDLCELEPSPQHCCTEEEQHLVDGTAQTELPLMIFNEQTRRCECPSGTKLRTNKYGFLECACTNAASDKAKCCPGEDKSNSACWTPKHVWEETASGSENCAGFGGAGFLRTTCVPAYEDLVGERCDSPGNTCESHWCGTDRNDPYYGGLGFYRKYKCAGNWEKNGW